jgi:hypothetical protein
MGCRPVAVVIMHSGATWGFTWSYWNKSRESFTISHVSPRFEERTFLYETGVLTVWPLRSVAHRKSELLPVDATCKTS